MSKRILCKFFVHGACLKGERCEFSHDWKDQPNNVCTFYQKGICSFGSRCRYDHVKVSRHPTSVSSSSSAHLRDSGDAAEAHSFVVSPSEVSPPSSISPLLGRLSQLSASSRAFVSLARPAWDQDITAQSQPDTTMPQDADTVRPSDIPICSFAAAGNCPRGDSCPHMHGDLCSICGKHCLHPFRPEEREVHMKLCLKNRKHLESLRRSQEIECCVCLDRVLSKPKPSERKFGLLSECDHPFCISCIRNWRSNSPDSGLDVNSALRACPICRKLSYFVIPSVIWYSSQEEKQEIVDSYKTKLRSIDCRHFDFGNGSCPFGTSCFYKHAYRDGRLEEVVLRHLDSEEGNTVIVKDIRISQGIASLRWKDILMEYVEKTLFLCVLKMYCLLSLVLNVKGQEYTDAKHTFQSNYSDQDRASIVHTCQYLRQYHEQIQSSVITNCYL